ncbi:hypothetical protein DICPUDRAFT_77214 [Dictyostelium purpureum]|uniref:Uncharacterized protein n=1 Tax=Dictyostelium purpureum TaxID=5786 RepID=F0ZFY3_DICPU|nr:uncharacterized protein DICPUDRAFT_77214 [Dictyostelium purpureum]EGC37143.1 hypothetical protein DICPUDRAFT_77214 [Dictyostelium purpureum]|eukprot:XP_003286346.1 hypothetical protein DICPUDRAFT_77214 [Dictyostelium purpureum]
MDIQDNDEEVEEDAEVVSRPRKNSTALYLSRDNFEKKVLAMETIIANMESKNNSPKAYHDNNFKKIIFWFIIIEIILATNLINQIFSSDTLSEKAMSLVYSFLISIIIYTFAKLYRITCVKLRNYNEKNLKKLYCGLERLFEERKRVTDYEHTKKLIQNYENFKRKNIKS